MLKSNIFMKNQQRIKSKIFLLMIGLAEVKINREKDSYGQVIMNWINYRLILSIYIA